MCKRDELRFHGCDTGWHQRPLRDKQTMCQGCISPCVSSLIFGADTWTIGTIRTSGTTSALSCALSTSWLGTWSAERHRASFGLFLCHFADLLHVERIRVWSAGMLFSMRYSFFLLWRRFPVSYVPENLLSDGPHRPRVVQPPLFLFAAVRRARKVLHDSVCP